MDVDMPKMGGLFGSNHFHGINFELQLLHLKIAAVYDHVGRIRSTVRAFLIEGSVLKADH